MRHLVIGCGEVGTALMEVLGCEGHDPANCMAYRGVYEMLHICFPYTNQFHSEVRYYREMFYPDSIVIHSTVPIGTSESLGAHHSPVRGRHPDLVKSLKTFVKYVGGPESEAIAEEFRNFGIPACAVASSRETEAGKLLDLMQFASSILLEKEIHAFCKANHLDFDLVYGMFNISYNEGFAKMGQARFIRPILDHIDGPIGGHCIVENMQWLDCETAKRVLDHQKKEVC